MVQFLKVPVNGNCKNFGKKKKKKKKKIMAGIIKFSKLF